MGEPIVDLDGSRMSRAIQKSAQNPQVNRMYGAPDHLVELVRRATQFGRLGTVPGKVIYDVEPIVFDDLIEVRTGGDAAVTALPTDGEIVWVSYWPLKHLATEDDVLSGWEAALAEVADTPHSVLVEVNSLLEQSLTFDFGYMAVAADTARLRRMTSARFVEELRDSHRRQLVNDGVIRPSARPSRRVTAGRPLPPPTYATSPPGSWTLPSDQIRYDINREPLYIQQDDRLNQIIRDQLQNLEPIPALDEPEHEAEPDDESDWVQDHYVRADDGRLVMVNIDGFDRWGNDPTLRGYSTDAECNCDGCRQMRVDLDLQDVEVSIEPDDDYDDDEYEEDDEG